MQAVGGEVKYDATIKQNGTTVLQQTNIDQFQYQTWHEEIWSNGAPQVNIQHDIAALEKTGAIQNYDLSIPVDPNLIAARRPRWPPRMGRRARRQRRHPIHADDGQPWRHRADDPGEHDLADDPESDGRELCPWAG